MLLQKQETVHLHYRRLPGFMGLSCNVFVIHQRHGPYIQRSFLKGRRVSRVFFVVCWGFLLCSQPVLSWASPRWRLLSVACAAVLGTRGLKWLDRKAAPLSPKQAFAYGWLNWDPAVRVGWIHMGCKGSLDSDFSFQHLCTLKLKSVPCRTHFWLSV